MQQVYPVHLAQLRNRSRGGIITILCMIVALIGLAPVSVALICSQISKLFLLGGRNGEGQVGWMVK